MLPSIIQAIFFIQTNDQKLGFPELDLCAFESAARVNKNYDVIVVASMKSRIQSTPRYLKCLKNLHFAKIDFDSLFLDSPVASLWKNNAIQTSPHAKTHTSDLLRVILLYNYGGAYFDNDIIAMKSLPAGLENFAVACAADLVNNAILKFRKNHSFLKQILLKAVRF